MIVFAVLGVILLVTGIVLALLPDFLYFFPYSLFFTIFVMIVVSIGIYAIHKTHTKGP